MTDIERLRRRVADTADSAAASALGWLLWRRDARSDEAIEMFALAMAMDTGEIPTPLLPRVADRAADYAAGLLERALRTAEHAVADLAVHLWNRIANILPHRADYLSRLGIALRVQFERTGSHDSLNLAVRAGETALLRADPNDPQFARLPVQHRGHTAGRVRARRRPSGVDAGGGVAARSGRHSAD